MSHYARVIAPFLFVGIAGCTPTPANSGGYGQSTGPIIPTTAPIAGASAPVRPLGGSGGTLAPVAGTTSTPVVPPVGGAPAAGLGGTVMGVAGMSGTIAGQPSMTMGGMGGANAKPPKTYKPTFTAIYNEIITDLTYSCSVAACHLSTRLCDSMDPFMCPGLSDKPSLYTALVGKTATGMGCGMSGMKLVDPGKPSTSLLYLKLQPNPPCGVQMRISGPYLGQQELDQIKMWIEMGAMNN